MGEKNNKKTSIILYIIAIIAIIGIVKFLLIQYEKIDYHDFVKSEYISGLTDFTRDKEVKFYNVDYNSYKVNSKDYNDAMFYKEVAVEKNTPYKITCLVKTQDVLTEDKVSDAGAQISIADSLEKSKTITGTNDWQLIELMVNSKDRDKLNVGFRLGGNDGNCKGTAWFTKFTIEKGTPTTDNEWKFACFVIDNTNIELEANKTTYNLKASMSSSDISDIQDNMKRFRDTCESFTHGAMDVSYDIIHIKQPLTSLSYDTTSGSGFYVATRDVKNLISDYLDTDKYDHIFIIFRTGTASNPTPIKLNDWIGLGSMDYNGIGFSEVQLVEDDSNFIFRYNDRANTFPEEVLVHEFLHTLERNLNEEGYTFPALHDNEKYGYKDQQFTGLKNWYYDYMNCNIDGQDGNKTGLDAMVYKMQPINEDNFVTSVDYTNKEFKEAQNSFDEIGNIIKTIRTKLKGQQILEKADTGSTN